MKVVISSGHGKYVPGASSIIDEVTEARKVTSKVASYLKMVCVEVVEYHDNTSTTQAANLNSIVACHNGQTRNLDISVHLNAYSKTDAARGVEVLYYTESELAAKVSSAIAHASGLKDRGAKKHTELAFLSRTTKPAILIEVCFVDSTADVDIYKKKFDEICRAIAEAISGTQIIDPDIPVETSIITSPTTTTGQLKKWAQSKNAADFFVELADKFSTIAKLVGINPAVVYCQSAKETNYGKFGGVLDESYCNPCGMKNKDGGEDKDPNAHMKFSSWDEGIQAQVDHLALYAGASGFPKEETPDPRHFKYLFGTVKTVESLGGKWAPSDSYGKDIVKMMKEVESFIENEPSSWAKVAWEWAKSNKITDGTNPQSPATREQVIAMLYNYSRI